VLLVEAMGVVMRRRFNKNRKPTSEGNTLTDRAVTTGLLYNYLDYVSPQDVDGIKRAYITVEDEKIDAKPIPKEQATVAQMYGYKPTVIMSEKEPTALIPKISPEDQLFPTYERFGNELLRSALRKIVDEV
jgi:hypothetical protein